MSGTPTIILASLSDDKLKESINSLVKHVNDKMEEMVESTNSAVKRMEDKLKSLGSLKIDTGGTNDGGTGRRTQQHEKLTKAVNDASEAVSKETQKLQDLQQSLSGASDREQNFISQKERAANTIAQENELLKQQEQELSNLKSQQSSFGGANQQTTASIDKQRESIANLKNEVKYWQSIVSQIQSGDKKTRFNSLWIGDTTSKKGHDILDVANKLYSIMQKLGMETEKGSASTGQAVKVVEQLAKYYKISREEAEKLVMSVQESPLARGKFTTHYDTRFGLDNLTMQKKDAEDSSLRLMIAQLKLERQTDDLALANKRLADSENSSTQSSQQKAQIDAQVAAKEKEIAETKGRIAAATREQTKAENNASQAAREKSNIQSQVANQEKQVAEAKKQLTTATHQQAEVEKQSVQNVAQQTAARDKQIKKNQEVATSFDQMAKAQQVAIRSANPSGMRNAEELQTMNIQLDLLRERLREARQQYSSFVALAAHATTTGDKGLFQYATDGVHRYEQEVRNLIPQIRTLQSGIQQMGDVIAPQGHTIQNYVNSLQKANPELAALNAQYKSGTSLLQDQSTSYASATQSAQRYTEEIRKQAQAIRESKQWKETGTYSYQIGNETYYVSKKQGEIEAQLVRHKEQQVNYQKDYLTAGMAVEQSTKQQAATEEKLAQVEQQRLGIEQQITQEKEKQKKKYISPTSNEWVYNQTLYNNFVKSRLGGKTPVSWKENTSDINTLNAALSQLRKVYSSLTSEERAHPYGQSTLDQIQRLERRLNVLRSEMSRPVSFNAAMGLPEKTLDDIAYKIRQLQAYKGGINLGTKGAGDEIRRTDEEIKKLKTNMDKYMSTGREVNSMNNALARSFNYMKNRLAFYFTVGASTAFVKNLINIRGQYELLERSIGILFDSMQTGTKIFSELNAMAIQSPFTTMELGAAAKQLSAYNIAAKDVVDTTRRLADIAAAVGVPIERLTYALGQIKSYGYLNSRDARMFANAGIPLIQNLADMYTKLEGRMVSIGDVYDRIKHKQVSFEDTLKVVNEMTDEGGRFFNFQEKAADTLVVRLANLTLAWNNMMNELGKDNTGLINSTLGGLKTIFEHWRDIDAAIWGVIKILGLLKGAQLAWLLLVKRTGIELALMQTLGAKLADTVRNIALGMKSLAANPVTWIAAAVVALGYMYQKWRDLEAANDAFNKSVSDGAQENINSINKFFGKYRKEIDSIGSSSSTDQEKMWERIREEIEKTTKNAQQYIDILEKIPDTAERVGRASAYLEHQQVLQQEAKRMADHGLFDLGGGFANDSLAKDLRGYENTMNDVLKKYGSLEEAQKDFNDSMVAWTSGHYAVKYYNEAVEEAEKELDNFTSILDKANLSRIMGEGSDEERLANIRSFAQLIRDNFLATEEGQKITTEGQARLNKEIDYWIARQGVAKGLINETRAEVEKNRSAWETFFSYLNEGQKKALDYLVSTGQTSTNEFKKIWNDAAKEMKESSKTAYEQIQEHIADLRKTAPIVIDVVYRETKESKDEAQKDFELRFLSPSHTNARNRTAEEYLAEQKRLNTIYGRFNKKEGEDMVEWESRLGKEYQDNEKKLADYNKMLEGYNKLSDEQKKKREAQINTVTKERDALQATQNALKEIQTWENFDFEQFKKGKKGGGSKKDFLGEAFAKVVEATSNMQKRFKEYKQAGLEANTALEKSTQEYAKTLEGANSTLAKYGIKNTKTGLELAKMELRDLRAYYESLLSIASGVGNTKGIESLEKAIASLNVEITKIDYKKITDGLNNELGKLKDEYELAVELDANPELGNMFASMFGIDKSTLPSDIYEYVNEAQRLADKAILDAGEKNQYTFMPFDLMKDDINKWAEQAGYDVNGELAKGLVAGQKVVKDAMKKYTADMYNKTKELQYKLADTNGKIAIEEEKLQNLKVQLAKATTDEQKKLLDLQIRDQENAIAKLKESLLQELPAYQKLFGGIAEHSARMTRRLASDYANILNNAKKNEANNTYTITDGKKTVTLSEQTYYKEVKRANDEVRKSQNPIKKIKEAFTKGDDEVVDFWKGIELVADEMQKLGDVVHNVGNLAEVLGADEETVEIINDIGTSISGVATIASGIGQMASGDYLAGAASIISGLTETISTWLDNSDNKIIAQIEESEKAVKRLETAYKNLEYAINQAYGTATIGANKAAIANKQLQLVELKRQLSLEQSRDRKHKDEDAIEGLRDQIFELEHSIKDMMDNLANDLLGISSVGDAAEDLMSGFIDALRNGEDAMEVFNGKIDDMITNMVSKMLVSKIIAPWFEQQWDTIQKEINARGSEAAKTYEEVQRGLDRAMQADLDNENSLVEALRNLGVDDKTIHGLIWNGEYDERNSRLRAAYEKAIAEQEKKAAEAKSQLDANTQVTVDDIRRYAELLRSGQPIMDENIQAVEDLLRELGLINDDLDSKNLSALQQGLQSMSEDTANSLEAYLNGVSQQVYLHSS